MSQNNNDNSGLALAFGLVCAVIAAMAIMLYFAALFVAFVLTIVSLFAWNSPVTIGKWTVTPDAARGFIMRGLAGAVLLPLFVLFLAVVSGVQFKGDGFIHFVMTGYLLGSLGVEYLMAQDQSEATPYQTTIPPSQQIAPPPQAHQIPAKPFRFASWDDEDGQ